MAKLRILLDEDEIITAMDIKSDLFELGYEVPAVAASGAEAIRLTAELRPDLILMDLFLPGMDGSQAIRAIMKGHPCAVLIVTEAVEENAAKVFEAMGSGALDAVSTPSLGGWPTRSFTCSMFLTP